jgi:hypothetical protein
MFDAPLGQTQGRGFHDPSTASDADDPTTASDADGRPRTDANGSPRSDAVMQVLSWLPSMLIEPD